MKKFLSIFLSITIGFILGGFFYKYILLYDKNTGKNMEVVTMNNTRPINELKRLVIQKGDTAAYDELVVATLSEEPYRQEFLLYSIIMANKYKYAPANYYVYNCLSSICELNKSKEKIDDRTKDLALDYLERGVALNEYHSLEEMGRLYMDGKYVKKDTLRGKKLLAKKASLY